MWCGTPIGLGDIDWACARCASSSWERSIDVHMRCLRMKLGTARNVIETVRGVGYRLKERSAV
ncbi:MAG TPA: helix-turn-helix domain-containing protein [Planctomycetaceae bacterium]|nr:helix-turn-helix domain-containing protein [Planctomycetaceae bacterium]